MFPPPSQNTVVVCNQITFVALYYISYRLVTFLKVIDAPIPVLNVFFILLLVSSSLIFAFRYSFLFVPEMSASITPYIVPEMSASITPYIVPEMSASITPYIVQIIYNALDPVTTAFLPACFDLKNLNILHQTMVYVTSICVYLDHL